MRIALCFSGMVRTFFECAPSIVTNIIIANPEHEFDSFMAVWDVHGRNPVWWEVSKDNNPVDFNMLMGYKKPLNIKKLLIDSFENSDFMKKTDADIKGKYAGMAGAQCNPYNFLPMAKKIEQAHQLMIDNGTHYDIVVKLRTDLLFSDKVNFQVPVAKTVYMPTHECWGPGSLNDQLLYGDGDTMSFHAAMYTNLDTLFAIQNTLHPETLLHNYYRMGNINVERHPIPYRILR